MISTSKPIEFSSHYSTAPLTISRCSFFTSLESWSVLDWTSSMGDCMEMGREGEEEGEDGVKIGTLRMMREEKWRP